MRASFTASGPEVGPACEALERRVFLTAVSWVSNSSGSWETGSNWSTGAAPTAADDVTINVSGHNPLVTIGASEHVHSINVADGLEVKAGSFTVDAASTVSGALTLDGGDFFNGVGLTSTGTIDWSTGTWTAANVRSSGTINLTGAAVKNLVFGPLVNTGTINQSGSGDLELGNGGGGAGPYGGTLDNAAHGVYNLDGTGRIMAGSFLGVLTNEGTLRKRTDPGAMTLAIPLTNTGGTIEADAGTLNIPGASVIDGGTVTAAAGASVHFAGGTQGIAFAGALTGTGRVFIDGDINQGSAMGQTAPTFNFPAGTLRWTGGRIHGLVNNSGSFLLATAADKIIDGGTLDNTGTVVHRAGTFDLGGGGGGAGPTTGMFVNETAAVFEFRGDANVSSAGLTSQFKNHGSVRKSKGALSTISGAVLFQYGGGSVDVNAGTLHITSGDPGSTGSALNVDAGSILDISNAVGSPNTFNGTYTGSGAGRVLLNGELGIGASGATFNITGGGFRWKGGEISAASSGNFTNAGLLFISGPNVKAVNGATISNSGTVVQTGAGGLQLGTIGGGGGPIAGFFNNLAGGTYTIKGAGGLPAGFGAAQGFTNAGVLLKTVNTGVVDFFPTLDNTGRVEVDAGTLVFHGAVTQVSGTKLTGGSWVVMDNAALVLPNAPALTENAGSVTLVGANAQFPAVNTLATNSGRLNLQGGRRFSTVGDFANTGLVVLGPASTLQADGVYTDSGRLKVQFGGVPASGQFGRLAVTGAAHFSGGFRIELINGYFPTPGDHFVVGTYSAHVGDFATVGGLPKWYAEKTKARSLVVNDAANGTAALFPGGGLVLMGTRNNDTLSLDLAGGQYVAIVNGVSTAFSQSAVTSVSLLGGPGDDSIAVSSNVPLGVTADGGAGADTIVASNSNDTLMGGPGGDSIRAGSGNNLLEGNGGPDTLVAGSGADTLLGGGGGDSIVGGAGNDSIVGGAGTDTLIGHAGAGADTILGKAGDSIAGGPNDSVVRA